ncbi:hypothetical protein [Legionella sp. W05-934-2]|uniref:hypothetical protein n=1 Tax=Legionella sp. W05-934-2 TaxID=1198649 RepID=UPI003462C665
MKSRLYRFLTIMLFTSPIYAIPASWIKHCTDNNGTVEVMPAEFQTGGGTAYGFNQHFCTFDINGGFAVIGLETFASDKSNIAASFTATLPTIDKNSSLWKGPYANPSANVCKNLGGSSIGFNVASGGFSNRLGQCDVCVFGDGSMVSSWTLIYIANGREGYDKIRGAIQSTPLRLSY